MSRTASATFKNAVYASETGEVAVLLITMDHASLSDPIRISTDNADTFTVDGQTVRGTISRGENYLFCPIDVALPDDSYESISQATLRIDNVNRDILYAIRLLTSAPTVTMEVVLASSPNTVEASFPNFSLGSVTANAESVEGVLTLGCFLGEPFPGGSMNPSNFPGMF
jgi:hypothetical protein